LSRPRSEEHHRLANGNTIIFGIIKKSLKLQSFSVVHHPSYCLNRSSNDFKTGPHSKTQRAGMRMGCKKIPVLVNVCPLYDAQRRSSSSIVSSSRACSSDLFTLSRKFFHSSSGFEHYRETKSVLMAARRHKEIRICYFKQNVTQGRKNLGKFFASRKVW
jgi:hypothetical protein